MSKEIKIHRNKESKLTSSKDGLVTISLGRNKPFKIGDDVLVTTSKRSFSALRKRRMVSDVVAHGVVQEVDEANIIVKSRKSPIVSYEAQLRAIQNESPIKVKVLK